VSTVAVAAGADDFPGETRLLPMAA
jgi:hypothetical protein